MERMINLHIERLPEGVYLATSDEIQGLVAQGRTVWETLEIARDVARKLLEESGELSNNCGSEDALEHNHLEAFDYPLVVEA